MKRADDSSHRDFPAHPGSGESTSVTRSPAMDETVRFTAGGTPMSTDFSHRYPTAGRMVFQRYLLDRLLGRGGMGMVWLARDTKLERVVALKFLPDILGDDPAALKDLKDETRRGLDLAHPNIVRIYDFVDDDSAAAISMEYVDGGNLSELRLEKPKKVFTIQELSPWLRQLCDALDYAHLQQRLVHRDLKPGNLMINRESQLKIADFGISRSMCETMNRVSMGSFSTSGTLFYMSPQQAMGDHPSATDDIYSIGAVIFELLTGKPPFYRGDLAMQITHKAAPLLSERLRELEIEPEVGIPENWDAAVAACLEKDPAMRPQTAGEVAKLLGLPAKVEPPPFVVHFRRDQTKSSTVRQTTMAGAPRKGPKTAFSRRVAIIAALTGAFLAMLAWWFGGRPGGWTAKTLPEDAAVTVGEETRQAPAQFTLKPGRYTATVSRDGFHPRVVEFKVNAGQEVDLGVIRLASSAEGDGGDTKSGTFEIQSVSVTGLPPQPAVTPPPRGFWDIDEIFGYSEYKFYSANGRRGVLHSVQLSLSQIGFYDGPVDARTSVVLHEAIQSFQSTSDLKANGLLDAATLGVLKIVPQPDRTDWVHPDGVGEDKAPGGFWTRYVSGPIRRLLGRQSE